MTSFVVYEGPSRIDGGPIVALAHGIDSKSKNSKTGPMIQIAILRADVPPWEALRTGLDVSICGNCIHRPKGENGKMRSCYVNLRFITPVWFAKREPWDSTLAHDEGVRFGEYGDPFAVPLDVWIGITREAKTWTGYTEFWRDAEANDRRWKKYFMASVQSEEQARDAHAMGWRYYRPMRNTENALPWEIVCPHYSNQVQCIDCRLCDGARMTSAQDKRKSIRAPIHGNGAKWFHRSIEAQRSLPFATEVA